MLELFEEGFAGAQVQVRVPPARILQRIQIPTVAPYSLRLDLLQLRILRRRQAPVSKQTPPLKFWLSHTAVVPRSCACPCCSSHTASDGTPSLSRLATAEWLVAGTGV